ncbi:MAG: dihydropteroate synthase [Gloeobacteraceae cyanobacterium ES-bin-144]|nr:dihydropteroate synthase [Verrucomicrobiales bacterium]
MIWKLRRGNLDLSQTALVMGILNVTPDSFSDGGRHSSLDAALNHARQMICEGAAIIDIGGESTRPGALSVSATDEIKRVIPIVSALRAEWDGLISIDTSKAEVAAEALAAGASIVNDVSGLRADLAMPEVCASWNCGVVVMHMQGDPRTMQVSPKYSDVITEVKQFFIERMAYLTERGISQEALCFDPGIGFGKSLNHNLALLRELREISPENRPLLLGVSRKAFIGKLLGNDDFALRDWPTVAITARTREQGVMLHRVHEVKANVETLRMTEAILGVRKNATDRPLNWEP